MQRLQLRSQLTDADASCLKGERLTARHFDRLIDSQTTAVTSKDGRVVAVLIKSVVPQTTLDCVLPHLLTLPGDLTNRAGVIGKGAQMSRIRKDGFLSPRKAVPFSVLKAHGGKGDQLGYFDRDCRETKWTREHPEVLAACAPLISRVNQIYRQVLPTYYARQFKLVERIQPGLRIAGTPFTTLTVNLNNRTACHVDRGDLREGMGCLTTHGSFQGGYFIMPKFRIAFDVQPGDILLADVHHYHGNAPFTGTRVSCVYYAREKMHLCPAQEAA